MPEPSEWRPGAIKAYAVPLQVEWLRQGELQSGFCWNFHFVAMRQDLDGGAGARTGSGSYGGSPSTAGDRPDGRSQDGAGSDTLSALRAAGLAGFGDLAGG